MNNDPVPTNSDYPWVRDERKREERRREADTQRAGRGGRAAPMASLDEARRLQADDLIRGVTSVPPPAAA